MHVAATVPDIEDLPALCYGRVHRIVAPLSFLLFVVAARRGVRHARGSDNRAVEVQSQACRDRRTAALVGERGLFRNRLIGIGSTRRGPARSGRHGFEKPVLADGQCP